MTQQAKTIQAIKRERTKPLNFKSVAISDYSYNEDSRTIEFYFAVWNKRDMNGEVSLKGCMMKSIREHGPESNSPQKILFLKQHDQNLPLGRITSIIEDNYGAKAIAELDKIQLADEVLEQIKSGTYNQFSYGFKYVWDKTTYDETTETIYLHEVQMFEISVVSIGASSDTQFLGFKSINMNDAIDELNDSTELFIKSLDSTKQLQARSIISNHISLALKKPLDTTLLNEEKPKVEIDLKEAISNYKF